MHQVVAVIQSYIYLLVSDKLADDVGVRNTVKAHCVVVDAYYIVQVDCHLSVAQKIKDTNVENTVVIVRHCKEVVNLFVLSDFFNLDKGSFNGIIEHLRS
jgi:hypothetical protein